MQNIIDDDKNSRIHIAEIRAVSNFMHRIHCMHQIAKLTEMEKLAVNENRDNFVDRITLTG